MRQLYKSILLIALYASGCEEGPPPIVGHMGADRPEHAGLACTDPGRVTLHRLNRVEYNRTIDDLIREGIDQAGDFPYDDIGDGFDNIATVLTVSPLHVEKYQHAAQRLAEIAVVIPLVSTVQRMEAEFVGANIGAVFRRDFWNLWSTGSMSVPVILESPGFFEIRVRAFGQQAGDELVSMTFGVGDQQTTVDVEAPYSDPQWFSHRVELPAGNHTIQVTFDNDFVSTETESEAPSDRNLIIDAIEIEGPEITQTGPPPLNRVMVCQPINNADLACAKEVVSTFASRAWRRPATEEEVERLMTLVTLAITEGDEIRVGIRLAIRGVLLSPHFTYRVEIDPDLANPDPHNLTGHELASRLAYFLWTTMPDNQLRANADKGTLNDLTELKAEAKRMLTHQKVSGFVSNFAGQWLYIRAMLDSAPDYNYFPTFDEALRGSMMIEAELFFQRLLSENLPITELLDSPITYINQRLANHYELDFEATVAVDGLPDGFRRIDLSDTPRRGLLGLGSVLTVTSFPTRTSPVKRGKWVLEQLMCDGPPPPPPGVETELGEVDAAASLRERLEQHRESPQCAGCHNRMDPIGLGMEEFDAIGRYRALDGDHAIDASGTLPDGTAFDGTLELSRLLKEDERYARCFQRKLFTYALGRSPEASDQCALDQLYNLGKDREFRLKDMILDLITNPVFTMRQAQLEVVE
jgi:hypothetical protein